MASYVVGDVHGCYYSLLALFDKMAPSYSDEIYFVGDLINKGPFSKKVIDQIIAWRSKAWNMTVIRGNHEEKLLSLEGIQSQQLISEFTNWYSGLDSYMEFFNHNGELRPPYKAFFNSTHYYIEKESYYLVHAGFNCKKNQAFSDHHAMTNIRNWSQDYDVELLQGKTVIHGHQSVPLAQTERAAADITSRTIPIDNGCVYFDTKPDRGYLTAIRLEDRKLFSTINLDKWQFR